MRKAMIFMLSLIVCLVVANEAKAQEYSLRNNSMVVGTGGFVNMSVGEYRVSGITGQLAIGKDSAVSTQGDAYVTYSGFWVPDDPSTSIDGDVPVALNGITNFPNPASVGTTFNFDLQSGAYVTLRVFGIAGSVVATVIDGYLEAGPHMLDWITKSEFGEDLASGAYGYQLIVNPVAAGGNNSSYSRTGSLMIVR